MSSTGIETVDSDIETDPTPERNFVVNEHTGEFVTNTLALLATLIRLKTKKGQHAFGPTDEELQRESGLPTDDFNRALLQLVNNHRFAVHQLSQEGTAGPLKHRYRPVAAVSVKVSWPAT